MGLESPQLVRVEILHGRPVTQLLYFRSVYIKIILSLCHFLNLIALRPQSIVVGTIKMNKKFLFDDDGTIYIMCIKVYRLAIIN
jgi:hypothetical protein